MWTLGSALLVAGGIVPHQINTVLRGDDDRPGVAEIIKSGARLNSGTTARTVDLPSVVKRIKAELKAHLPGAARAAVQRRRYLAPAKRLRRSPSGVPPPPR